ncbi:hypothetical protein [Planotetraspora kaengkrachanensis]|nr:hypothetical protein [Planotetraspora kaengkrachanensis]
MGPLHRYDSVDLTNPPNKKTGRGDGILDAIEFVLNLPFSIGKVLLLAAWGVWRTRIPRLVKILIVGVITPVGAVLLLLELLLG